MSSSTTAEPPDAMEQEMNAQQEHEQPRREGFGGRVRRFIDSELNRAVDRRDSTPDSPSDPTPDSTPEAPASTSTAPTPTPASATAEETAPASPSDPTPDSTPEAPAGTSTVTAPATAEETAPPPRTGGRRVEQAAADGSAQRVGLLNDPAGLRDQWQQVQATFVDDPQQAVHEASVLVDRTLREIHENVSRGQISDPTSTEDLRVSFQRYREFFQRLLSA